MASISENYGAGAKYAKRMCAGYKSGGGVSPKKAVHKHEDHLHPGQPKTKLKAGGHVKGKAATERPDRRARGGKIGSVVINIKAPGQGDGQGDDMKQQMAVKAGLQKGVAIGAQMAAAKGPMPGAGGPPPPGSMPGGPPGGPPPGPMMRAKGGRIPKRDDGGSIHSVGGGCTDPVTNQTYGRCITEKPDKNPKPDQGKSTQRAHGGKIHMTGSAAGGLGRLEKSGMVNVKAPSRRRGGACS